MKRLFLLLAFFFLLGFDTFAAQAKKVDVYITSWCPYCGKLQDFLTSNHIEFTSHDIEKDPAAHKAFYRMGGQGIPLTRVGDDIIHGYDPDRVTESLQEAQS